MGKKIPVETPAMLKAERDDYVARFSDERMARVKAEKALEESRGHFADLKERLHNAEVENARLRGYLERIHDADIARDGLVEIIEGDRKRMVPKWRPPLQRVPQLDSVRNVYDERSRDPARTHWTNY